MYEYFLCIMNVCCHNGNYNMTSSGIFIYLLLLNIFSSHPINSYIYPHLFTHRAPVAQLVNVFHLCYILFSVSNFYSHLCVLCNQSLCFVLVCVCMVQHLSLYNANLSHKLHCLTYSNRTNRAMFFIGTLLCYTYDEIVQAMEQTLLSWVLQ